MFKYVTQTETRKWIVKLYDFFKGNNNSYHSMFIMTPLEASIPENTEVFW